MLLPGRIAVVKLTSQTGLSVWLAPMDFPGNRNVKIKLDPGSIVMIIGTKFNRQGIATVLTPKGTGHVWADMLDPITDQDAGG